MTTKRKIPTTVILNRIGPTLSSISGLAGAFLKSIQKQRLEQPLWPSLGVRVTVWEKGCKKQPFLFPRGGFC